MLGRRSRQSFVLSLVILFSSVASGFGQTAQSGEILTAVTIQGNVATSDDDIIRLAGVQVGTPLGATAVDEAAARLRATKRFRRVEVRKRFASISDPTQIVLVIVVDEGPVKIERTGDPAHPTRVVRSNRIDLLVLPILSTEDGYGVTYGARLALPDPAGPHSRLAFPLSWGGDKRAAVEFDKAFDRGPLTRFTGGGSLTRRTHPFFQDDEDRGRFWIRGEHTQWRSVRAGASAGWQHVSFLGATDRFAHAGADLVFDTRQDPISARNAVYARVAWDHLAFRNGDADNRTELDGRGYIGLAGQSVLALRVVRLDASHPLPPYLKPILGGLATVRGFAAGTAVGDTLAAGSAELRVPLTSPLSVGKIGVSAFFDVGSVYDKGARLGDQPMKKGYGGSVWFSAAFLRLDVAVAHGVGSSTRMHVAGGVTF